MIVKPWGNEEILVKTDKFVVKKIGVDSGERLSKQFHKIKDEVMFLLDGYAVLDLDGEVIEMKPFVPYHVYPRVIHRLTTITGASILEVSTPELDDVVRLEDDYGRVGEE